MPDMQKLLQNKEKILSTVRIKGPSLPVQIARAIEIEPMLASAFLSELKAEQRIKISNLKVGSSPLYYLPGQESQLENFIQHLNQREKEAFQLLKQSQVLEDESLSPVQRVALRSLKDFAIPIRIRIREEVKLFWKYFSIDDNQIRPLIQKAMPKKTTKIPKQEIKKEPKPSPTIPQKQTVITQTQVTAPTPTPPQTKTMPTLTKLPAPIITKPKKPQKPSEFANKIKSYLTAKDIEILETINEKKRELTAKIRIDTLFGKQSLYLIAKDKKSITENDLNLALQKAQLEKMPALIISPGNIAKKAQEHAKNWQNLVKFEKINL